MWDDASALNRTVWNTVISNDKDYVAAVSGEALRGAKRACELTSYEDPSLLDTLARVYFERGELNEAIRWQEEAMKFVNDDLRQQLMETLATYEAALKEVVESPDPVP